MSVSDLQEFEDDYSSYSESASEDDFFADLLERYTCTFRPEYCLKLRKSTKPFQLGLNCSRWRKANHFCAVLKPNQDSWLRKVTLSSQERRLEVSTKKFHFGQDVLTFSAVAGLDIERLKPSLGWKFSTRWSLGTYKIGRKEKFPLGPAAEFRPRWKLDYSAPEVEGAVGGDGERAVQVDQGHAHLSIPRVEMLLQLDDAWRWCRSLRSRHSSKHSSAVQPAEPVSQ